MMLGGAGKPRGYAFIEYEHKNDMKQAYKMADGRKVEGRRVLVDVERGRTVPNWWAHRHACPFICHVDIHYVMRSSFCWLTPVPQAATAAGRRQGWREQGAEGAEEPHQARPRLGHRLSTQDASSAWPRQVGCLCAVAFEAGMMKVVKVLCPWAQGGGCGPRPGA